MKLVLLVLFLVISMKVFLPKSEFEKADAAFKEARAELRNAIERTNKAKLKF